MYRVNSKISFKYVILQNKTIHSKMELELLNIFYGKSSRFSVEGSHKKYLEDLRTIYLIDEFKKLYI